MDRSFLVTLSDISADILTLKPAGKGDLKNKFVLLFFYPLFASISGLMMSNRNARAPIKSMIDKTPAAGTVMIQEVNIFFATPRSIPPIPRAKPIPITAPTRV